MKYTLALLTGLLVLAAGTLGSKAAVTITAIESGSDVVFTLNTLFTPGTRPPDCLDAADSNDDGRFDISDAVFLYNYVILAGPPPPLPGPTTCGPDPTPDPLSSSGYDPNNC